MNKPSAPQVMGFFSLSTKLKGKMKWVRDLEGRWAARFFHYSGLHTATVLFVLIFKNERGREGEKEGSGSRGTEGGKLFKLWLIFAACQ